MRVDAFIAGSGRAFVACRPNWFSRTLAAITGGRVGRRSFTRIATRLQPGSHIWVWADDRRVVDDVAHAAIDSAIEDDRIRRVLDACIRTGKTVTGVGDDIYIDFN